MWLITRFGLYSVREEPQQRGTGMLTIRGRVGTDLETLREHYLPAMGPIELEAVSEYRFRATAPAAQVAAALCKIVADIDYAAFVEAVAHQHGEQRALLYQESWKTMLGRLDPAGTVVAPAAKPSFRPVAKRRPHNLPDYGGVVTDGKGRFLLRKPANDPDGFVWTFFTGRVNHGEVPRGAVQRIARKEMGVEAEARDLILGKSSDFTVWVVWYLMLLIKDHSDFDRDATETLAWCTPEEARTLIAQTRNSAGQQRDLDALAAAVACLAAPKPSASPSGGQSARRSRRMPRPR